MKVSSKSPIEKFQVVDLARTAAIMLVLALHLKPTLPLPSPLFRWGWDHLQRNGEYGVCMFFVISGFLITRIIDLGPGGLYRPGWKWFYARRIGRIVPLFLFAIGLGLLFHWIFQDDSKKFNYCFKLPDHLADPIFWGSLLTSTFNWAEAFYSGIWNHIGIHWIVFWSLSVEEQFYFFYPLILKKLGTKKNVILFLIFVIAAGLSWRLILFLTGERDISISMRVFIGSYDQIAMGALLYLAYQHYQSFLAKNKVTCWALVAAGSLILIINHLATFCIGVEADRVYAPSLVAIGLSLFLLGGLNLGFFESKYLKLFALPGKYSYGNYLFHMSVLYFLHLFMWNLNIVVAFLVFVGATTIISSISYHFYEVPANRFIRRHLWAKEQTAKI